MPNAYAQRLRIRLFLEGIEVPVISANIQTSPNAPMVASIQLPPLPEGTRLLPRTLVHLFFLDGYESTNLNVTLTGASAERSAQRSPSAYESALIDRISRRTSEGVTEAEVEEIDAQETVDRRSLEYKLLFGGEVMGFQWTKNQSNRSLVLQCSDWSNYWDYAYQWNNTGLFGPGLKAMFSGGATNLFTDFLSSKGSMITNIVASGRCNSFPRLKGLAAGIIRLMESIGGSYFPAPRDDLKPVKKYAGANIFFSLAELRLHITHMVAAFEDDPTSAKLLSRHGYRGLFNRALGGLGGQVSIRKSINALTRIMFHETFAQPCPYYKPASGDDPRTGSARVKIKDDPRFAKISDTAEAEAFILDSIIDTINENQGNVDQQAIRAARVAFVKEVVDSINNSRSIIRKQLGQMRDAPDTAKSAFSQATKLLGQASVKMQRWRPNAPDTIVDPIIDRLRRAKEQMDRIADLTVLTTPPKQRTPARLNQQILRPDIWFGAPPRCNVLFPEDYATLSYQRMFLQEPTRFMLKVNDEFFGEDFLFDKFYFAPQAGSLKADKARLSNVLRNDLLDHELFTGILPVFEKMGEFNVFASKSGTQKNTTKVSFAQRSANFIYFKHRFNARQMRIDGKFNPYIACGCPGLVIDKYVDRQQIEQYNELRAKAELPPLKLGEVLGTNFLGNFTALSHRVSQNEPMGRTEITASYPRQPEESVEFLGSPEKVQTVRKKAGEDAIRVTDIAAIQPPRIGSLGPNNGRITGVVDVTSRYTTRQPNEVAEAINAGTAGATLPIFQRGFSPSEGQVLVPLGTPVSAIDILSPKLEEFLGDPERRAVFSAFRVVESIARYRGEEVDLPAEEFIRPGWYGDIWTTGKIGRVYEDFFGIGAITDGTNITDASGASIGATDEEMEQALADAELAEGEDDPRLDAPAVVQLEQGSSIQQAVEFLVLTYSYIKQQNNLDIDDFINAYRWRPIATMVDMFGTSDLAFSENGENVVSGFEGFHSRAFGPFDDVFGLVGPDLEDMVGIKRGTTTAQKADVRKRRYEAVQQFVSALKFSRAILG